MGDGREYGEEEVAELDAMLTPQSRPKSSKSGNMKRLAGAQARLDALKADPKIERIATLQRNANMLTVEDVELLNTLAIALGWCQDTRAVALLHMKPIAEAVSNATHNWFESGL